MDEPPGGEDSDKHNSNTTNISIITTEEDVIAKPSLTMKGLDISGKSLMTKNEGTDNNDTSLTSLPPIIEYKTLYEESQVHVKQLRSQLSLLTTEKEELKEKYDELTQKSRLSLKIDNGDPFVMKKRTTKADNEVLKCEFLGCNYDNHVNLIKCNACGIKVCESCHKIDIVKYKSITNKCSTTYFFCRNCNPMLNNSSKNVNNQLLNKIRSLEEEKQKRSKKDVETKESHAQTESGVFEAHEELRSEHENLNNKLNEYSKLNTKLNSALADLKQLPTNAENNTTAKLNDTLNETKKILTKTADEAERLKQQEIALRSLLDERENRIDELETRALADNTGTADHSKQLEGTMIKRLDIIAQSLKQSLAAQVSESSKQILDQVNENNMLINEKLNMVMGETKTYATIAKNIEALEPKDPSASVPNITDFRTIMEQAENEKLIEDKEKEKRDKNIMVYGLLETGATTDEVNTNDVAKVEALFNHLKIHVRPTKFTRIGDKTPDKIRPIKLEMFSVGAKDTVMNNLKQLKNAGLDLGKLSVRDDLTPKERELLKKFVDTAKQKSADDTTNFWVVRGTPKNGLSLVQRARKTQ